MQRLSNRALVVGVDHYSHADISDLQACVQDATRVQKLLSQHDDGKPNFDCRLLTSASDVSVTRSVLRENVQSLFSNPADMALFYFSGHGDLTNLNGYIVTQDATDNDVGLPMSEVLQAANKSTIKECVLILDCCFSGQMGQSFVAGDHSAELREGVTVLAASRPSQAAEENNTGGLFTSLLCEALDGGAADLLGTVTTTGVYAHVQAIFGAWEQRPIFKTHVSRPTPMRFCKPSITPEHLRKLPELFVEPKRKLPLDKTFEPEEEPKGHPNEKKFSILQDYCRNGLVRPNGEAHMYFAAMKNKSCSLTALGQFYWQLAKRGKI